MNLALLILRLTVGLLMMGHGSQKLFGLFGGHGLRGFGGWLGSLGYLPAMAWAVAGVAADVIGGLLFALGFLSPLGTIGIGAAMLTAITKAHWPKLWSQNGGFEYPLVLLVVAVAVGISGPGAYSLDALLGTGLPPSLAAIIAAAAVVGYLYGVIHSARRPAVSQTGPAAA